VSRKLSGEATASELAELSDLIKTQANTDLYLQAIEEFWKIPPEKDEDFLEATYHIHLNRLKEKGFDLEKDKETDEPQELYFDDEDRSGKLNRKKIIIALSVLSAIILAFIFYNSRDSVTVPANDKIAQTEVSTKSGSRTNFRLPDGTTVWLNGNSKLEYDIRHFGESLREVTLIGEAYFDVVKNNDKPFIIHANKVNIKVVGTSFNVKAYPGEKNTETSLIHGSIEVTMTGVNGKCMMKPNDKLIIPNEAIPALIEKAVNEPEDVVGKIPMAKMVKLTVAQDEQTIVETAWVENRLVFDHETFEELSLKMERFYGVSIRFEDKELKSEQFSGSFEKETFAEALNALQLTTPFKYNINNRTITIFK
jgi:ferric-dicitrate binding protein FerR (iron transport regulator)